MTQPKEGYAAKDVVAAFEQGHTTKLTAEDRQYIVSWLKITRPTMTQVHMAKLLGVSTVTIQKDIAQLDETLSQTMQAIDVGLVLAEAAAELKHAAAEIHKSMEIMEQTEKGRTNATYLQYRRAPFEMRLAMLKTMKDIGLIGDGGEGVQEEYRYKTITSSNGVITSEFVKKINQDIERARPKAFEPGTFSAPKQIQIEAEFATEDKQINGDNSPVQ